MQVKCSVLVGYAEVSECDGSEGRSAVVDRERDEESLVYLSVCLSVCVCLYAMRIKKQVAVG